MQNYLYPIYRYVIAADQMREVDNLTNLHNNKTPQKIRKIAEMTPTEQKAQRESWRKVKQKAKANNMNNTANEHSNVR